MQKGKKPPQRIIGGVFGIATGKQYKLCRPRFLPDNATLLINVRSGIHLLVKKLQPDQIWLPSYMCADMLRAVENSSPKVRFFEVNYNLEVAEISWIDEVKAGDLVIFINYFGFPIDDKWVKWVKAKKAWVIEDNSQALLSKTTGEAGDFKLFSPRKFLGVPDGGILISQKEEGWRAPDLEKAPVEWWLKCFRSRILRRDFDLNGGDREWYQIFRDTEDEGPIGPYAMSDLSEALLRCSFDYQLIAKKRIENYLALLKKLISIAIFPDLPAGIVPLGFPIRVKKRDSLRQKLFQHEIYPPIHWEIEDVVPKKYGDSHRLSKEIMTLPCDQRYGVEDMRRIVGLIMQEIPPGTVGRPARANSNIL